MSWLDEVRTHAVPRPGVSIGAVPVHRIHELDPYQPGRARHIVKRSRRIQAVARLNATGERGEDLVPAAEFCARVIRRLYEAAEQVRRSIP